MSRTFAKFESTLHVDEHGLRHDAVRPDVMLAEVLELVPSNPDPDELFLLAVLSPGWRIGRLGRHAQLRIGRFVLEPLKRHIDQLKRIRAGRSEHPYP